MKSSLPSEVINATRILIVDDEVTNVQFMLRAVERFGFPPAHSHTDPREALTAFAALQPTLMLVDQRMPHMTGIELVRRLRAMPGGDSCKFFLLTGAVESGMEEEAEQIGIHATLQKPLMLRDLLAYIDAALSGAPRPEPPEDDRYDY